MDYSGYQKLIIERKGKALWITLNNPPLNPVCAQMHAELAQVFPQINADESVRVVVITGSGNTFSAGGNIQDMKDKTGDLPHHMRMLADGPKIVTGMLNLRKPIIARINGHAVGFGATLALLSDITIAINTAKLGDPHVKVGLAAGDGGSLIWPMLIGFARAREYLLTGKTIVAANAEKIGLINHAVDSTQLDEKVEEYEQYFSNGPSLAISHTKTAINMFLQQYASIAAEAQMGLEGQTIFSEDHTIAVDAFLEGRKPIFR